MLKDRLQGIRIIYEDRDIIVIDKPPGLLTIATETDREHTAYRILTAYVRRGAAASHRRIFIVHRLDRDTSGILIFAKNERAKLALQQDWDAVTKRYVAVVHGILRRKCGTITSYLAENRAHVVYSTRNSALGKFAVTAYRVIKEARTVSLVMIDLMTGRKNQIRVHFAEAGHPVVGDVKYGRAGDGHKRLALHAHAISFRHPSDGRRLSFETAFPAYLAGLVGGGSFRSGTRAVVSETS